MTLYDSIADPIYNFFETHDNETVDQRRSLNLEKYKPVTDLVRYLDGLIPAIEKTTLKLIKEFGNKNLCIYNYQLKKEIADKKCDLIRFCIYSEKELYPEIDFNYSMLLRYGNYMPSFDAEQLIEFIQMTYDDVDKIIIDQLQFMIIDQMVGYTRIHGEIKYSPENIKDIYTSGIELNCPHYHYQPTQLVNAVVRFAKICIGRANNKSVHPSEVRGIEFENGKIREGVTYSTEELPSIKLFGNGKVKIRFRNPHERNVFKKSLFMPSWKLLGRPEPKPVTYETPCSVCMFSGIICEECNDFDKFVGHCDYCKNKLNYPVGSSTCEQCRNGKDMFTPVDGVRLMLYRHNDLKIKRNRY